MIQTNSQYPVIASDDIDASIELYTNTLGYHVLHTAHTKLNTRVVVLENSAGQQLEFIEATGPIQKGLHGLRMNVKDLNLALEEVKKTQCKILIEPVETNTGISFTFLDNNNVPVTIIQHIKK